MQVLRNVKAFKQSGRLPIEVKTKKRRGRKGGSNQAVCREHMYAE